MIDHRQPFPRFVRPVPRKEDALVVLVHTHSKTIGGNSVVPNGELLELRRLTRARECDRQTIRRVRVAQRDAVREHGGRCHPLPVRRRREIEEEARKTVFREANRNSRLAADFVVRIGELERESIVLDLYAGLAWIRIPRAERQRDEHERGEHR